MEKKGTKRRYPQRRDMLGRLQAKKHLLNDYQIGLHFLLPKSLRHPLLMFERPRKLFSVNTGGVKWPEVRMQLLNRGKDLTRIPEADLPAWDEVAGDICARMKFTDADLNTFASRYLCPNPVSLDYIRNSFDITGLTIYDSDVVDIQSRLEGLLADGQAALQAISRSINRALAAKCAAGDYFHSPFTTIEDRPRLPDVIFVGGFGVKGWAVRYMVARSEIPEAGADLDQLAELTTSIKQEISSFLESKRHR